MNIDFDNAERMETGFTQTRFVIEKVSKNSTRELGLKPQGSVRMSISRRFSIDTDKEDISKVKMESVMDLSLEVDDELFDFLYVRATFPFRVDEQYQDRVEDKDYQRLFAVQANVQLTDFVNSLLMNSELKGDKIPYDVQE